MKKVQLLSVGLMILIFLSSCQAAQPIMIGFSGGLSGKNASVAISGRDAVLLAVEEINQQGGLLGRPVELIIENDLDTDEGTSEADRKLMESGASVIIGHFMSHVAEASMKTTQGKDVLMVSPTISTTRLNHLDDQFIRVIMNNTEQGRIMANYAYQKDQMRRSYLIYNKENQEFVKGVADAYEKAFNAQGGQVIKHFKIDERDQQSMNSIISKMSDEKIDSVMMIMSAGDVAMFAQLLSKSNQKVNLYSATWGMTMDAITQGGKSVEGIKFPALFDPKSKEAAFESFRVSYEKAYKTEPDFAAIYAYEAIQLVFEGIKISHSTNPNAIKKAIIAQKTFKGLQSNYEIDSFGDVSRPQFIVKIRNGVFETVDKVE